MLRRHARRKAHGARYERGPLHHTSPVKNTSKMLSEMVGGCNTRFPTVQRASIIAPFLLQNHQFIMITSDICPITVP